MQNCEGVFFQCWRKCHSFFIACCIFSSVFPSPKKDFSFKLPEGKGEPIDGQFYKVCQLWQISVIVTLKEPVDIWLLKVFFKQDGEKAGVRYLCRQWTDIFNLYRKFFFQFLVFEDWWVQWKEKVYQTKTQTFILWNFYNCSFVNEEGNHCNYFSNRFPRRWFWSVTIKIFGKNFF